MDGSPITFKNLDVYKIVTGVCETKEFENWFLTPPRFTTIRINQLLTSEEEVKCLIQKSLNDEALRRGVKPPLVWNMPGLPELLAVDPWPPQPLPQPPPQREVVVDAACGAAVLRGANVFAPGVLAVPSGTQEEEEVSVYADTAGLCLRGLSTPFDSAGKMYVGTGVMRMSRKQLFKNDLHPKGVAVEMTRPASDVSSVTISPQLGLLQNLPSVVCSRVLDPQPGDRVIDLCAAPGHKTTHIAALMRNQGVLVALDKIAHKVEAMKTLCKTMGAEIVRPFTFDATKSVVPATKSVVPDATKSEAPDTTGDWEPPFHRGTFDRVLLDAPCSALGQRPQLGNRMTCKQLASHPKLQRKLFDAAVRLLKPGGSMVYSTCSVTVEENEDIVSWALKRYPYLELVPSLPSVGGIGSPKSSLTEEQRHMVQRFGPPAGPSPPLDTIGFFIAKFNKLR